MRQYQGWLLAIAVSVGLAGCGGSDNDDNVGGTGGGPGGPGGPGSAGVAEAKSLTSEVRTIAGSTENLQQPMDVFGQQVQAAADSTETAQQCIGNGLGELVQAIGDCYDGFVDPNGDDVATYNGPLSCPFMSTDSTPGPQQATITITPNTPAGHDQLDIDGRVADSSVDLTAVFPREGSETNNAITTLAATLAGTIQTVGVAGCGTAHLRVTLGDANGPMGLVLKKVASPQGNTDTGADLDEADLSGAAKLESLGGANPVTVEGSLAMGAVRCTSTACGTAEPVFNPDLLRLIGTVRDANDSETVTFEASMSNARSFNNRGVLTSANPFLGSFRVIGNVSLNGQPVHQASVAVNLTGATNPGPGEDHGKSTGNVTAVFTRSTMIVTLIVENSAAKPEEIVRITVRNEKGAEMVLTPTSGAGGVIGTVRVDGVQVGTVEETSSGVILIRYIDGTVETLG